MRCCCNTRRPNSRIPRHFSVAFERLFETVGQETYVLHFKDGRIFERFSCPLVCDGRKVGHVSSFRDVTAKRQAERLAAIGEMAAGLAHENRNAMQRMQACLEMLALEVQDRPEALDLLNRMQAAQDRLHHLHEEVREYAAPIVLNCEPVVPRTGRPRGLAATGVVLGGPQVHFRCFAGWRPCTWTGSPWKASFATSSRTRWPLAATPSKSTSAAGRPRSTAGRPWRSSSATTVRA